MMYISVVPQAAAQLSDFYPFLSVQALTKASLCNWGHISSVPAVLHWDAFIYLFFIVWQQFVIG